jgi:hypothetical protein
MRRVQHRLLSFRGRLRRGIPLGFKIEERFFASLRMTKMKGWTFEADSEVWAIERFCQTVSRILRFVVALILLLRDVPLPNDPGDGENKREEWHVVHNKSVRQSEKTVCAVIMQNAFLQDIRTDQSAESSPREVGCGDLNGFGNEV